MLHLVVACTLIAALSAWSDPGAAEQQSKRVLLISAYGDTLPAAGLTRSAIRRRLQGALPGGVEILYDPLDLGRFPGNDHRRRVTRFLTEKYTEKRPDVLVALEQEALRFLLRNRHAIAPGAPIVFCCMSASAADAIAGSSRHAVTGAVSDHDWGRTIALAARLQPDARNVVLISGASDDDRLREAEARNQLGPHLQSYNVRYLAGLPYDALLREVRRLPRESIVLLLPVFRDGDGRPRTPRQVAADVAKASSAPVYAVYDTFIGQGIVGGYMDTFESAGTAAAALVLEILGNDSRPIPAPIATPHSYRVDARQLERWGFSESSLPAGTDVLYREPTLWERHPNTVLGTTAVFALLTIILVVLSLEMIRRRRAEALLRESEERMAFAAASSNIGLWQYDVTAKQLWATEHCRSMLGLHSGPLTAARLLRAIHPDNRRSAAAAIRSIMRGGQAVECSEFQVVDRDGRVRWLSASTHIHLGEGDQPIKVSGVFRDITERKSAETEARQLSQRLLTVQDEERRQIALELHDSTMQHLAASSLNMMSLKTRAESDAKTRKLCEDIEGSLEEASRELRTFTYLLHPPELETDGLRSTMHRFVDGFAARTGLKVSISISPKVDALPLPAQQSLLRVVQEALANVRRHASATRVAITLRCIDDQVDLMVSDDGKGFKRASAQPHCRQPPRGVGIPGMTARLRQLGGDLEIHSGETGTTLHGMIPSRSITAGAPATRTDDAVPKH